MGFSHPDSFRFMEALEWGCIPILKKYNSFDYHTKIWGDSPIPKIDNWSELNNFANLNNDQFSSLYNTVFNWYKNYREQ
jgi:hypothetical protein